MRTPLSKIALSGLSAEEVEQIDVYDRQLSLNLNEMSDCIDSQLTDQAINLLQEKPLAYEKISRGRTRRLMSEPESSDYSIFDRIPAWGFRNKGGSSH